MSWSIDVGKVDPLVPVTAENKGDGVTVLTDQRMQANHRDRHRRINDSHCYVFTHRAISEISPHCARGRFPGCAATGGRLLHDLQFSCFAEIRPQLMGMPKLDQVEGWFSAKNLP